MSGSVSDHRHHTSASTGPRGEGRARIGTDLEVGSHAHGPQRQEPGPGTLRSGVATVVVLNYRGADDTIACLQSLDRVDWPASQLEVICVDNASGDGSVERIRAACPDVTLVAAETNGGFAGGMNLGVQRATGAITAILNNDARVDPAWIREAMAEFDADPDIASVASRVLDWEGDKIDYVDGSLTWYGMGYKREAEQPNSPAYDTAKDVLFATGAAMFVRTDVFLQVGGFDERFFMFYEDVDLGWRLNLLGYRVRYAPTSVAYHKHHATIERVGQFREHYLLERNALMSMYKNFGDEVLSRTLPAAMALSVRRSVSRGGDDPAALDLQHRPGDESERIDVAKDTLSGPYAIDSFVEMLPTLARDRAWLQSARVRSDADLLPLFRQTLEPAYPEARYLAGYRALVDAFGIEDAFSRRRRIAIVTGDPLGAKMAGPAIRAWEIARALSAEHDVRLATTNTCSIDSADFDVLAVSGRDMHKLEEWCDVLIFQGLLLTIHPWLKRSSKVLVADIYDPFHLEILEQSRDQAEAVRRQTSRDCVTALNDQLARADFMLCASPKQRDFWLGQLAALGRVNPDTYDDDENLDTLIEVVPFGLPDTAPKRRDAAIKGVVPGIGADDKVVIWGGGIYNWFDPLTLIRAIDGLKDRVPDVRLFFLGTRHPNPDVPEMRMAAAAAALADRLELTGKHVFFNDGWVRYEERADYLLDADVGVSCHLDHVETAFSFRTRILDYLWAGLPIVTTAGDTFGDLVASDGLGFAVPAGDAAALERALYDLLTDDALRAGCAERSRAASRSFRWSTVMRPLIEFCRSPRRAPDLLNSLGDAHLQGARSYDTRPRITMRDNVALAKEYFRTGGVRHVVQRASGRVTRVTRELTSGQREPTDT